MFKDERAERAERLALGGGNLVCDLAWVNVYQFLDRLAWKIINDGFHHFQMSCCLFGLFRWQRCDSNRASQRNCELQCFNDQCYVRTDLGEPFLRRVNLIGSVVPWMPISGLRTPQRQAVMMPVKLLELVSSSAVPA